MILMSEENRINTVTIISITLTTGKGVYWQGCLIIKEKHPENIAKIAMRLRQKS